MARKLTKRQEETIQDNYRAFVHNFGVPRIERDDFGKGFYVFLPADSSSWIQYCYSIEYLDGWLYGCVQGAVRGEFETGRQRTF